MLASASPPKYPAAATPSCLVRDFLLSFRNSLWLRL